MFSNNLAHEDQLAAPEATEARVRIQENTDLERSHDHDQMVHLVIQLWASSLLPSRTKRINNQDMPTPFTLLDKIMLMNREDIHQDKVLLENQDKVLRKEEA